MSRDGEASASQKTAAVFASPPRAATRARLSPVMWLPGEPPPTIGMLDAAISPHVLAGVTPAPSLARSWSGTTPAGRVASMPAVQLCQLPPWAVLFGGTAAVAATEGRFIAETLPQAAGMDYAAVDRLAPFDLPAEDIAGPLLLTTGPDIRDEADWLMRGLPAMVFAEQARPGHYRYLLPDCAHGALTASMVAALGIGPSRCLWKRADRAYRFADLAMVSGAAPDGVPHPAVLTALKSRLPVADGASSLLSAGRGDEVANSSEINAMLAERGFAAQEGGWLACLGRARVVLLWPDQDPALLLAAARGVAVILAAPGPDAAARGRVLVGRMAGFLVELTGAASVAAEGGGIVLDPTVLTDLLDSLPS